MKNSGFESSWWHISNYPTIYYLYIMFFLCHVTQNILKYELKDNISYVKCPKPYSRNISGKQINGEGTNKCSKCSNTMLHETCKIRTHVACMNTIGNWCLSNTSQSPHGSLVGSITTWVQLSNEFNFFQSVLGIMLLTRFSDPKTC